MYRKVICIVKNKGTKIMMFSGKIIKNSNYSIFFPMYICFLNHVYKSFFGFSMEFQWPITFAEK